jgi:N6-adenosine-specific RNA methylase IME4
MFSRGKRKNWTCWGNQTEEYYPEWETYKNHSQNFKEKLPLAVGF